MYTNINDAPEHIKYRYLGPTATDKSYLYPMTYKMIWDTEHESFVELLNRTRRGDFATKEDSWLLELPPADTIVKEIDELKRLAIDCNWYHYHILNFWRYAMVRYFKEYDIELKAPAKYLMHPNNTVAKTLEHGYQPPPILETYKKYRYGPGRTKAENGKEFPDIFEKLWFAENENFKFLLNKTKMGDYLRYGMTDWVMSIPPTYIIRSKLNYIRILLTEGKWNVCDVANFWQYTIVRHFLNYDIELKAPSKYLENPAKLATTNTIAETMNSFRNKMIEDGITLQKFTQEIRDQLATEPQLKQTLKGEFIMNRTHIKTIKQQTLINGVSEHDYTTEMLMEMVVETEKELERLNKMQTESKAVAKLKKILQENIDVVVKIMDSREEE